MTDLEQGLRELIREIVRDELRYAKSQAPAEHISTKAAAEFANVAERTIRRWIDEGKLAGYRAGRLVRVRRADLERLLHGEKPRRTISPEELADRDSD